MSTSSIFHTVRRGQYRRVGVLVLALCLAFMSVMIQAAQPTSAASYNYVFSTFLGDAAAQEKLSIYTSTDGTNFTLLSNTGFTGSTGVLRDPSIIKNSDGKFYIAYTNESWTTASTSFGIASSSDLIHWTEVAKITSSIAHTHFVWAPEWFQDSDGSIHIIVNIDDSGNGSNFRIFDYTSTNSSLTSYSGPVQMIGSGNYIDADVIKIGSTYHIFAKGPTWIETATASNLNGPYTWIGTGNWAGWGSGKEGPSGFKLANGNWRMIIDYDLGAHQFVYSDSADGLKTWTKPAQFPGMSGVVRHGTVVDASGSTGGGTTSYDDESSAFAYTGSHWTHSACNGGDHCFDNTNSWESTTNEYAVVSFTGTQIKLYAVTDKNMGYGAASIDGGSETNVDFYSNPRNSDVLVWTSPTLTKGSHTLKIRITGTHDGSSTGNTIALDRADVLP